MHLREEPGKQKTRSCRAQELSRSRAQGKERQNGTNFDLSRDCDIGIVRRIAAKVKET